MNISGSRSTRSTLFTSIDESDIESLTDSIIELADGSEGFMHTVTKNIQTVSAISESVRILSKSESANSEPESTNTEGGTHTCTLTVAEVGAEYNTSFTCL